MPSQPPYAGCVIASAGIPSFLFLPAAEFAIDDGSCTDGVAALAKFFSHDVREGRKMHITVAPVKLLAWVVDVYRAASRQRRRAVPAATTAAAS